MLDAVACNHDLYDLLVLAAPRADKHPLHLVLDDPLLGCGYHSYVYLQALCPQAVRSPMHAAPPLPGAATVCSLMSTVS